MVRPHGGKLIEKFYEGDRSARAKEECKGLERIGIDSDVLRDLENIAHGVFSPLSGFMNHEEVENVVEHMRLPDDKPWTIPIMLPLAKEVKSGEQVVLEHDGKTVGTMDVEEVFRFDKKRLAEKIYGTVDAGHPGVSELMKSTGLFAGGRIILLEETPDTHQRYNLKPKETRILFREKGWRTVVGFQTRNVPHLGHEYVQKTALTFVDGIFINPVIGKKKEGDFRDDVILKAYEELMRGYYLKNHAVMATLRTRMRYAGPREAVFHAIVRKNFGCSHFIIGRDHAGVGSYYEPYAAQEIFEQFPDLGIIPLFFRSFYYCRKCEAIVNEKICPHPEKFRRNFSGSELREKIIRKEKPEGMMRREVLEIILKEENPFVV